MPTLRDILELHGDEYLRRYGRAVPRQHRRVIALLRACQTGALGRVVWQCEGCGHAHQTARSCGNRHCPACQTQKNERWLEEQSARRLDVPYFLITFTLPATLRPFVRSQQRVCYAALFRAASGALEKLGSDPRFLGAARLGFTAVLHTWGRAMTYHPHLHVVLPAGGVSDDSSEWLASRPDFFVPVKALSIIFRAKFRDELAKAGLLDKIDPTVWSENFITDSRAVGDGESTLRYLSRYVFRVAISNTRIVSLNEGRVRFLWKKSRSHRWRTMELDALEFIRRFLEHVLPEGFQKVRHYGFLSPRSAVKLDDVRRLVAATATVETSNAHAMTLSAEKPKPLHTEPSCPSCGKRLRLVEIIFHRTRFQDTG